MNLIFQVHPVSERDPVALAIHHYPVLSTFAFFNKPAPQTTSATQGSNPNTGSKPPPSSNDGPAEKMVCVDPNWQEEMIMDGKLVFGVNPYREICTLHLAGQLLIDKVRKSIQV